MFELESAMPPDDPSERDRVDSATNTQKKKNRRDERNWKVEKNTLSDIKKSVSREELAKFYQKIAEKEEAPVWPQLH